MVNRIVNSDVQVENVVDLRDGAIVLRNADVYVRDRTTYEVYLKPAIDFIAALVLIVLFSPVLILCSIAVYISLGFPIILRQPRVGLGGRVFNVYKFRSMEPDRRSSYGAFAGDDRRISHKRSDDPRLTPTGKFLRKWSFDELPQFFNVLQRDMSLVGPRPELLQLVAKYDSWQHKRHAVKPGITCIWQISQRGDQMLHEATELDIEYIAAMSLRTDISILMKTPIVMLGLRPGH